jgi:TonB family protein
MKTFAYSGALATALICLLSSSAFADAASDRKALEACAESHFSSTDGQTVTRLLILVLIDIVPDQQDLQAAFQSKRDGVLEGTARLITRLDQDCHREIQAVNSSQPGAAFGLLFQHMIALTVRPFAAQPSNRAATLLGLELLKKLDSKVALDVFGSNTGAPVAANPKPAVGGDVVVGDGTRPSTAAVPTMPGDETPTTEYRDIMKSNTVAVGPRGLSQHVNSQDYGAIVDDLATLKMNLKKLETFWIAKNAVDAIGFVEASTKAAADLETAARAKDQTGVTSAWTALLVNCTACHVARVRRLEDGTFAIMTGAVVPASAKVNRDGTSTADGSVGTGSGAGATLSSGGGGGTGGAVYRPGSGIALPRVLREVKPQFTAAAMSMKIQGTVLLETVVRPDGSVGDVQVLRSVDPVFGLDEEAIKAAKQWRFSPGTRLGEPVPVYVTIELTFRLR